VVGTIGCSKCDQVKFKLNQKKIEYEYKLFTDLNNREQDSIQAIARENDITSFPIILDENNIIVDINTI
jgi:glutaredoxin